RPIAGWLLTDANVDHLGGLAVVRQTHPAGFAVYSSEVVKRIATAQTAFAAFDESPHRWEAVDAPFALADGALRVTPIPVPGLTPGYAGRERTRGAVLAYRVADATGASV